MVKKKNLHSGVGGRFGCSSGEVFDRGENHSFHVILE